jgi:hypothetical protein
MCVCVCTVCDVLEWNADVFFADQLCSLVLFFQDFWFTSCFFAYDAWIDEPYVCTAMDPYVKPLIGTQPYLGLDGHDTTRVLI